VNKSLKHSVGIYDNNDTVKPRYLATFGPGHDFGDRRGWSLNGGNARMRPMTQKRASVYARTRMCCIGLKHLSLAAF